MEVSKDVAVALECVGFQPAGCVPSSEQAKHHSQQKVALRGRMAELVADGRVVAAVVVS